MIKDGALRVVIEGVIGFTAKEFAYIIGSLRVAIGHEIPTDYTVTDGFNCAARKVAVFAHGFCTLVFVSVDGSDLLFGFLAAIRTAHFFTAVFLEDAVLTIFLAYLIWHGHAPSK